MPESSLPHWLRVQAAVWLPLLAVVGADAAAVPWPLLCGAVASSFGSLCALLRSGRTAADLVTIARAGGVVAVAWAQAGALTFAAWLALLLLALLDLVDGLVARRWGATPAGAVLDMEADQATVLVFALLVVRGGGPGWVLLAPALRYLFVLAMWAAQRPAHDPRPVGGDNRRGRRCCAAVVGTLLAALLPGLPRAGVQVAAAAAVLVLALSFASDARHLLSRAGAAGAGP